jgi:hypothetical protein
LTTPLTGGSITGPAKVMQSAPRCHKTLIQELATYMVVTFDDTGRATDRFMVGGDFGYYCPNCPTIVINPADVKPYLDAASTQFEVGKGFAVLGRVALEGFTEEEQNTPVGELKSIPIVPFHESPSPTKSKSKSRQKRKRR